MTRVEPTGMNPTDPPATRRVALTTPHGPLPPPRRALLGCDRGEIERFLAALGEPAFRATQLLEWIYVHRAASFASMSNLSRALRDRLAEQAVLYEGTVERESVAEDGTRKLLIRWPDGATVETVWIPSESRHTACLSSQVGCPAGCGFCASGIGGLERNLAAGEIVEQALRIAALVGANVGMPTTDTGDDPREAKPPRLSHIVLMGMGEPLANYDAVLRAIRIIHAPWGLNIGSRRITLSTVGLPKQIRRLADEALPINLALSLHATEDALRQELMPWGERISIRELLDACAEYSRKTRREITLEYVLLAGVNDLPRHAKQLADIARRLRANVNLLRYNPVPGLPFRRPTAEAAFDFQQRLRAAGANAHIRTSRGKDVQAACGQLRRESRQAATGETP